MQLDKIAEQMADHIASMAKIEGFKDYARERLKELVRCKSGLFDNLPALVKQRLEKDK